MPALFLGLVVVVLLFLAAKWFSKADPKQACGGRRLSASGLTAEVPGAHSKPR